MTTFGTDLKDQVPIIADHVADGIAFLDEFRSFAKDRAQIEKEYSQKLESLCKKYNSRRQKIAAAKTPTTQTAKQEDEWDWADKSSSTSNAWSSLLQQTETVAKTRHQFAEDLATGINDVLKTVAGKKEEARKKHVNFYQKLRSDLDKAYAGKDKAKQAYDDACVEVENLRTKLERGTGDQEKYNKHLEQAIIDRNNAKNLYILAIGVANTEKKKYFDTDIPELSNRLQGLNNTRIQAGQQLLTNYISLDTQALNASVDHLNTALTAVGQIDCEVDSAVFVRKAIEKVQFDKDSQVDFAFMPWNGGGNPSVIIDRDENMIVDDAAVVFLNNNLIKNKRKLTEVNNEMSKKTQEVSKLQEKLDGLSQGAKYGAYDELNEASIFEPCV
ncbi:Protein BZZ1 [Umbelopsis sp. WA50703]